VDVLGSVGVAILLAAFGANLMGWVGATSRVYQSMNAVGAALAAAASYGIGFWPFVVLEATWCIVAVVSLLRPRARRQPLPDR
jgi:hypothetical protein